MNLVLERLAKKIDIFHMNFPFVEIFGKSA